MLGPPLSSNSNNAFFDRSHDFILSNSTMWSIGTQNSHYYNSTNGMSLYISLVFFFLNAPVVLERLAMYSMPGAEYNSRHREYAPQCHPNTRKHVLSAISASLRDSGRQTRLIRISGPAGVGKSTVMQTLVQNLMPRDRIFAALFLSKEKGLNDVMRVFPTIAYQLAVRDCSYSSYLEEQFRADPKFLERSLGAQFHSLFVIPFAHKQISLGSECCPIFVDALEECQTKRDQRKILELVHSFVLEHPSIPIAWIFTTRPKHYLEPIFFRARMNSTSYEEYHLSISSQQACDDVKRYLVDEFRRIRDNFPRVMSTRSSWPTQEQILKIASASLGFFAFASAIIHFIDDTLGNPVDRLFRVLDFLDGTGSKLAQPLVESLFKKLDTLYTHIMSDVPLDFLPQIKLLLGYYMSPAISDSNKTLLLASNILGLESHIAGALHMLSSVLVLPPPSKEHVEGLQFLHHSFVGYLQDSNRSNIYWVDPKRVLPVLWRCYARIWLQWLKSCCKFPSCT